MLKGGTVQSAATFFYALFYINKFADHLLSINPDMEFHLRFNCHFWFIPEFNSLIHSFFLSVTCCF